MSRLAVAILLTLVAGTLGVAVTQQQGSVAGRPDITVATDQNVTWGQVTLPVEIVSEGLLFQAGPEAFEERVTTARGVQVRLARNRFSDALAESVTVTDGTIRAGSLPSGARETFAFGLDLDTDLPPGRYQLPVILSYNFTALVQYETVTDPTYSERTRRELRQITLVVEDRPNLVIDTPPNQAVASGRSGSYRVVVRNTGTETARDVGVRLQTVGTTVTFGGRHGDGDGVGIFVASIPPGESVTVRTVVTASPRARPQRYLVIARVDYSLPDGEEPDPVERRLGINVTASPTVSDKSLIGSERLDYRRVISASPS